MRTTDLPSWLWLPLQDNCEWDSPFNMGNCFDEQYHNIFFAMMKMLIDLTRFTTFPFLLFVLGMYAECMATLPMAFLSIITIIPMILMRLIWAEEYHIHGGMGNPVVAYSVQTWIILSTPNIVLWAPSAAFAVSQWVRIVEETIISLRIQAHSSFDFEILFPDFSAGRVLDSDLSQSGAEAWMKKLVQEDQDQRQSRREEEESVRADQEKMGQASLLVKKLNNETHNAIWRAISKRRPQSILRRQSVLSHRQETELLAEERGPSKTKILAQRYVVVPVDQSTQSAEIAPAGSSPSTPPPPSARKTTPEKPFSSPTTTAAATAPIPSPITPAREEQRADFSPVREPTPSVVTPRQEVVEPIPSLPSPAISGVGVVSSSQVVDEPIFSLEEEHPPLDSLPSPEAAGLESVQQPSPPEQAAASDAFFIPEIPAELLITPMNESGVGLEESLHQGLFQSAPHISEPSTWDPLLDPFPDPLSTPSGYIPESDLDAGLDALCLEGSQEGVGLHNGNHGEKEEEHHQPGDEMAIDVECEDVEMEEQDEGEVQVLTSSQAGDVTMGEGEVGSPTEEEEQEHISEAWWAAVAALLGQDDFELGDAPAQAAINQPAQLSVPQLPLPPLPAPRFQEPQPQQQASIFHLPLFQSTQTSPPDFGMSEQEQWELAMEMEAEFDSEMVDAVDHSAPPPPHPPSAEEVFPMSFARVEIPPSPLAEASPADQSWPTIPVNEQFQAETEQEIAEAHHPLTFETRGNTSKDKQRRDEAPDPAKPATKEQMEKRRVLKPRVRGARTAAHTLVPGSTTALPATPSSSSSSNNTQEQQQQQQIVAPVMMGGLMLPGGNRTITSSTPELVPAAPQTPTISAEQKAAFEKKKAAQIKAQQEARKNKKPSIFHQKKPTTPGRSAPNTPRQTSSSSSPMPQIKDPGDRAAAESIFGTPGSGKKNGLVILPSIPDHLRDQVAGHRPENEGED